MKPTIGRVVIFHVDDYTRSQMNKQGNIEVDDLPAIVVRAWTDTCLNLKVLTDGPEDIWVTSVSEGTGPRNWSWPERN